MVYSKPFFLSILFASSISFSSWAFTLNSSTGAHFSNAEITINVADHACTHAGISAEELLDKVEEAVDLYWNRVPTSSIRLKAGSVLSSVDIYSDDLSTLAAKAADTTILVGCNDNTTDIFTSDGPKGVGGFAYAGDKITHGYLVIRDTATNGFDTLDATQKLAVIAHEIGHSIGIGHSSFPTALMYYSLNGEGDKVQENLSIDDYDAVSYLYPAEGKAGIIGSCATVSLVPFTQSKSSNNITKQVLPFLFSLMAGFGIITLLTQLMPRSYQKKS